MACPASAHPEPEEILLDSLNPAATVGTVAHRICEQIVRTGDVPDNWQDTCRAYGLTAAETTDVGYLVYAAKAFWDAHGAAFENPEPEVPLYYDLEDSKGNLFRVSTHQDVVSVSGPVDARESAIVGDWKSTRLDVNYTPQMIFYAWVLCLRYPSLTKVTTCLVFLRDRTANIQEWTREQVQDFADRYTREVVEWEGHTYRPGGHCGYCRRFANCAAHKVMGRQAVAEMELVASAGPSMPTTTELVDFYQRVQAVSSLVEKAKAHVRAAVEQCGGELVGGNGQSLKLVPSYKPKINAQLAWPVITETLSVNDFADAVVINKGDLLKIVSDHAPRGQKGKAQKAMVEALEAAKAITKTEFNVLRVMQTKETVKEIEIGD